MRFFIPAILLFTGCISPSYFQRKIREARGEPEVVKVVNGEQEYRDFMEHKTGNGAMPEPLK